MEWEDKREWQIVRDVEGDGHGLFVGVRMESPRKTATESERMACKPVEI
jgi:hypothetical protein